MTVMKRLIFLLARRSRLPCRIYVANSAGNNVTVIDPSLNKAVGYIKVSNNPHGSCPHRTAAASTCRAKPTTCLDVLSAPHPRSSAVFPSASEPQRVAITQEDATRLCSIREESGELDTRFARKSKEVPVGKNPHNVYATPTANIMIATSMGENKLTVINTETEQPEFAIPVGGVPRPVTIDARPDGTITRSSCSSNLRLRGCGLQRARSHR
jgi:YVTN family beta-propeller protein